MEQEPHLVELIRYVPLNPVRAGTRDGATGSSWTPRRRCCSPRDSWLLAYVTYGTYATMAEHLGVGAWAASLLARGGETLAREDRDFDRKAEASASASARALR